MADNNETGNVGLSGGVGAAIGAVLANGGFGGLGGGNREALTLSQIDDRFNSLQGQMAANSLREQGADSTIALGAGLASVKDAIVSGNAQIALQLCGINNNISATGAATQQTILLEAAKGRELTQQTEINRLLAANAQLHNDAGHARTQVMVQALASAGGSGN